MLRTGKHRSSPPRRFIVEGADRKTGLDKRIEVTAFDAREAETIANQQCAMLVGNVTAVGTVNSIQQENFVYGDLRLGISTERIWYQGRAIPLDQVESVTDLVDDSAPWPFFALIGSGFLASISALCVYLYMIRGQRPVSYSEGWLGRCSGTG